MKLSTGFLLHRQFSRMAKIESALITETKLILRNFVTAQLFSSTPHLFTEGGIHFLIASVCENKRNVMFVISSIKEKLKY